MLIIASYTAAVCIKQKGVLASISATFYRLEHKNWFMATTWLTAGLLMPAILEVSRPDTEFLAFLACAGMFLVGAAPNFKEDFEGDIHELGAICCIVGSQLWVMFNVSDSVIADFYRTKPMFWVEIAALLATYMSVFILI